MKQATSQAPGKLMLVGEHAVVYGYPCIVISIGKTVRVTIQEAQKDEYISPVEDSRFVDAAKAIFSKEIQPVRNIKISIATDIGSYGLGSSSATTVATIQALAKYCKKTLSKDELFSLCYSAVQSVQRVSSGFDIASAIWGGIIYFDGESKHVEPLHTDIKSFVVGFTGKKAQTVDMIEFVRKQYEEKNDKTEKIFKEIADCVYNAKNAVLAKAWQALGSEMNRNQECLSSLGVSTPEIDACINAARNAGAYGAKMSGAGGGDCIIALSPEEKVYQIEDAIKETGGKILHVQ